MLSTPTIVTFMSVNRSEESPVDPGRGVGNCGTTYGEEVLFKLFKRSELRKGKNAMNNCFHSRKITL